MPEQENPGYQSSHRLPVSTRVGPRFNKFLVGLYALGHFTSDCYGAFLSPLLPEFQRRFALNKFMCGTLAAAQATTVSLIQPLLGFAADRLQTRKFLVLGPGLGGAFCSLIGTAPSYRWLVALLVAGGLGIGAFHPSGAALAAPAGGRKRHLALSIFVAGGILGAAVGYRVVVALVEKLGLRGLGPAMVPGLLVSGLLYRYVPSRRRGVNTPASPSLRGTSIPKRLRLLYVIALCRALISVGVSTFTPILLSEWGYPLAAGGSALGLYMLSGAGGNLLGGWLAEKVGPKAVIISSLLLAFPALVGFTLAQGPAHLPLLMASGVFLLASVPAEIGLAQKNLPHRAAAVSGIFTGAVWGIGGLSMMAAGALADRIGTQQMMLALWPLALVGALVATGLAQSSAQD